jgi:hypothetical protein
MTLQIFASFVLGFVVARFVIKLAVNLFLRTRK